MIKTLSLSGRNQQVIFAALAFVLAVLAVLAPSHGVAVPKYVGGLLVWVAILVFIQGFQRATLPDRRGARFMALTTLLMGLVFSHASEMQGSAFLWITGTLFGLGVLNQLRLFMGARKAGSFSVVALAVGLANLLVLLGILFIRGKSMEWIVSIAGALRIAAMGMDMLFSRLGKPEQLGADMTEAYGMIDHPEFQKIASRITAEEDASATVDKRWIMTFIFILFFMHLGRMGFDRSASGLLSPMVALIGDLVIALIIAFLLVKPLLSTVRSLTRPMEKTLWKWVLAKPDEERPWYSVRPIVQWWLELRLRLRVRLRKAGYALPTAVRTGLQTGLPFAALLAAIVPVFGMSWYFDTENWAAGVWDGWAASRADSWRQAMITAVEPNPKAASFTVKPAGVDGQHDFSFVVIGDPGEGDNSQYVLHDQIVRVSEKPEVKFVVISSDVVYPDGAMKDYEANFWLPMMGVRKPVYAIPGNHDWYDALDGFAATFFDPATARAAMRARRKADLDFTTLTYPKIEETITEADRLRREYRVPTGLQQVPFFQVQTKDFAFISLETGVLRRIDELQMRWLKQTLEASKGKFIMVLLGHPFYAAGEYQGDMNPDFAALHQLLREHKVQIAMAGDTHDLEYYLEPLKGQDSGRQMHHFVNGGGGAYLSIGAALMPREKMPEKVWAHYPNTRDLVGKIESNNGSLKKPAWKWTRDYNGWPFSAEWLSAAFDYNVAPYFQSFMEVRVERSKNQVRLLAYTQQGPLTWAQLEKSSGVMPEGASDEDPVEWVFPLR